MKKDDCVFCKIIKGDIPSATIYENEEFKVILDRFPSNLGHVLVLPKQHIENIFEMPEQIAAEIFKLVTKVAPIVKEQLNCDGINIIQNNGEAAGQSVPHFHIHIIPRHKKDGLLKLWKPTEPTDEQIEQMKQKLSKAFDF